MNSPSLTDGQKYFLDLASKRGVSESYFSTFIPEIMHQEEKNDGTKPTIAYIHTGGTLMMVPSRVQTGALSFENAIDIPQVMKVCDTIAGIRSRYNVLGIYLANTDSKEIKPELWTAIAATIQSIYDQVEGVVVGHGTHTLEHSAAATAYALQRPAFPAVFTASQVPIIGFPGSDGLSNLTGAMEIAAYANIAEVVAYANGTIFRGTRVTKKNDRRLDIFESRVTGPLGYFTAGGIETMSGTRTRSGKRKYELLFRPEFSKYVTALKIQPGMSPEVIDKIIESRDQIGLLIETYGSGALPKDFITPLSRHITNGARIFVSSSCAESGVSASMSLHDEDAITAHSAGIRNVGDMTTTAATVKLMHILGNSPDATLKNVQEEMGRNYAGEMTNESRNEGF